MTDRGVAPDRVIVEAAGMCDGVASKTFVSLRGKVISGTFALGTCSLGEQGLRFLRQCIVARVLSTADYGIAATFMLTTVMLDMLTNFGFESLLVQAKEGDDRRFGGTAQTMLLVRGVFLGLILLASADLMAALFRSPETAWAFRILSVVPVVEGLAHRDVIRLQRQLRYGPYIAYRLVPSGLTLALAWPVCIWLGDYRVILVLTVVSGVCGTLLTYLVSERGIEFGWDAGAAWRFVHFGWPLLVNGVLMYLMVQGDRWIVAIAYDSSLLGVYSVAVLATLTARDAALMMNSRVMLPVLSAVQSERVAFRTRYELGSEAFAVVGSLIGVVFVVAGAPLVVLFFGEKYADVGSVIGWMGVMQMVRVVRGSVITASIAIGDTKSPTLSSAARGLALVPACVAAFGGASVVWIPVFGVVGEVLAMLVGVYLLRRAHGLPVMIGLRGMLVPTVAAAVAAVLRPGDHAGPGGLWVVLAAIGAVAFTLVVSLVVYGRLRKEALSCFWRHFSRARARS